MKASRFYLVGALVLAVALAWTSATPQVVDASEVSITGACGTSHPRCEEIERHQCSYMYPESGCCPNWQDFCVGSGNGWTRCYYHPWTNCGGEGACKYVYEAAGCWDL
jgi:hypothetical protein